MAKKNITIIAGADEFTFDVDTAAYNRYINAITPSDKVAPTINFLRQTLVDKAQRPALDEVCDRGLAMEVAGKVLEEFQGELEITVKN